MITLNSINLTQGSTSVSIDDVIDLTTLPSGYSLYVDGLTLPLEISSGGNQTLTLASSAPQTLAGRAAKIEEVQAPLVELMDEVKKLNDNATQLIETQEEVFTSTDEEITYTDRTGTDHQIPTAKRFENLLDDVESAGGNIKAMRSVVYDAMCEANKLKYGASGFVEMGKHASASNYNVVNQGLACRTDSTDFANYFVIGRSDSGAVGSSNSHSPIINVDGSVIDLQLLGKSESINYSWNTWVKLPPAPDGLDKSDGTGRFADLSAAIVAGGNDLSASVLNRKDLVGVEVWDELVSDKDIVVPLGNVQYGASSYDGLGLAHITNYGIGQGYCAFYDGDTATKGYGAPWAAMSDTAKATFLNNPKNNLRYVDGQLVQRRFRIRTIAGLEGDWFSVNPYEGTGRLGVKSTSRVIPQGKDVNVPTGFNSSASVTYVDSTNETYRAVNDNGAFSSNYTDYSFNGFCVFIPIALVERMNQGAYHPVYNENGTKLLQHKTLYSSNPEYAYPWYHDDAYEPTSVADCYTYIATNGNGVIGSISGHFAGLFYDAIYADQITDLRLDVSRKFSIEGANRLAKRLSINGTASANETEYVPFTKPFTQTRSTFSGTSPIQLDIGDTTNLVVGDKVWSESGGDYIEGYIHAVIDGQSITVHPKDQSGTYGRTLNSVVLIESLTNHKSKYRTDIIGTPSEILATFPDGVHGAWIPVIPDGTSKEYKYTRKVISDNDGLATSDNGSTWLTATSMVQSGTSNSVTTSSPTASKVYLLQYEYAPNFTEPANQARVDYCDFGIVATNYHYKYLSALVSTLIGKVSTTSTGKFLTQKPLTDYAIDTGFDTSSEDGGFFDNVGFEPTHDTIDLEGVDSPAVKEFTYSHIPDSGIVEHYVVFKEMVFDSGYDNNDVSSCTEVSQTYTQGNLYRVEVSGSALNGMIVQRTGSSITSSVTWSGYSLDSNGNVLDSSNNTTTAWTIWDGNGFGDDNKFNIVDGEAFVTDLNGNTIKVGCHKIKGIPQIFIPPTQLEQ